jgi:hypothetical protein
MNKFFTWSLAAVAAMLLIASACTGARPAPAATPDTPKPSQQPVIRPPVISDIVGPRSAAPHSDIQLTCMAQDMNGGTLTYAWSVDKGTLVNSSTGTAAGSIVTWTTPDTVGTYNATVKVSGSRGGEATFTKPFSIVDPSTSKTTVPGTQSADTTVYLNLNISSGSAVKESRHMLVMEQQDITCVIKDQDVSGLTFIWSAPQGGKLVGDGLTEGRASRVGWRAPGVPGNYSVNVTISDKSGHQASGQVDFDVAVPLN